MTCTVGLHSCCLRGHYKTLYCVIDERTQEVKKLFGCPLAAEKYKVKHNLWLVQTVTSDIYSCDNYTFGINI